MRRKSAIEERLVGLVEPALEGMGLELVDLELKREAGGRVLRIFIDSPKGVDLDVCASASEKLSALLDAEDPIEGPYTLEVSSPGLERPLTKKEHFARYVGERARVKTFSPIDGRRDITGVIAVADDAGIEIDVEGKRYRIGYDLIAKANLKPEIRI